MPTTPAQVELAKSLAREHRQKVLEGQAPSIEQLLASRPGCTGDRHLTLRLVLVEFATRIERDEQPTIAEYRQRFPQFGDEIESLVAEKLPQFEKLRPHASTHRIAAAPEQSLVIHPKPKKSLSGAFARIPAAGESLGRFQLRELLGRGAFGAVYRAHDPQLDREVALKIPRPGTIEDEEDAARFLREARAAGQLRHPNIVPIFDAGRIGETCYISCGLIAGRTLQAEMQDKRKLAPQAAARLVSKLAQALHYAHGKGIVHRDVKPANIMLDADGDPVLMDFGLARRDVGETLKTMEGSRMGTPAYMSPEQASGKSHLADGRSDQWSLGVLLFELLSGQLPFQGSGVAIYWEICHNEPANLRSLEPTLPRDLQNIVARCLRKDPQERYEKCDSLAADLHRFLVGDPVSVRPLSLLGRFTRWSKRNPVVAGMGSFVALAVVAIAVVLGYAAWSLNMKERALEIALADAKASATAAKASAAAATESEAKQRAALLELQNEVALRNQAEAELEKAEQEASEALAATDSLTQAKDQESVARQTAEMRLLEEEKKRQEVERRAATDAERRKALSEVGETSPADKLILKAANCYQKGDFGEAQTWLSYVKEADRKWEWSFLEGLLQHEGEVPTLTVTSKAGTETVVAFDATEDRLAVLTDERLEIHHLGGEYVGREMETVDRETLGIPQAPSLTPGRSDLYWNDDELFVIDPRRIVVVDCGTMKVVRQVTFPRVPAKVRLASPTKWLNHPRYTKSGNQLRFQYTSKINGNSSSNKDNGLIFDLENTKFLGSYYTDFRQEGYRQGGVDVRVNLEINNLQRTRRLGPALDFCLSPILPGKPVSAYVGYDFGGSFYVFSNTTGKKVDDVTPHLRWLAQMRFGGLTPDGTRKLRNGKVLDIETDVELLDLEMLDPQWKGNAEFSPHHRWLGIASDNFRKYVFVPLK